MNGNGYIKMGYFFNKIPNKNTSVYYNLSEDKQSRYKIEIKQNSGNTTLVAILSCVAGSIISIATIALFILKY